MPRALPAIWAALTGSRPRPAAGTLKAARAARTLGELHQQAKHARAELARLRKELAETQAQLAHASGADLRLLALREANQQLLQDAAASREAEADVQAEHTRQITFLAMVAHELRNPLLPLRLAAAMLAQARTDDARFAGLQATIASQTAHMARLIGDLLDGSRVSAGKFRLERSRIDMAGVIHSAIETIRPAMDERKQRFGFTPSAGRLCVHGDAMRLVQVLVNLLENAVKYTSEGGEISLRVASRAEMVEMTIADNGIGISPEALSHVFELFVQDKHAVATSREGLGIGLAVVRDLIEAHGGSVVANSPGPGRGSEFVVLLPLLPAA